MVIRILRLRSSYVFLTQLEDGPAYPLIQPTWPCVTSSTRGTPVCVLLGVSKKGMELYVPGWVAHPPDGIFTWTSGRKAVGVLGRWTPTIGLNYAHIGLNGFQTSAGTPMSSWSGHLAGLGQSLCDTRPNPRCHFHSLRRLCTCRTCLRSTSSQIVQWYRLCFRDGRLQSSLF